MGKREQQQGLRELMDQWAADDAHVYLAVTLTMNDYIDLEIGERRLRQFDAEMNRAVTKKRNWQNSDNRVVWFALPEKWHDYPHYHLVVRLKPDQVEPFRKHVVECWKKQVATGEVHLNVSPEGDDWVGYITKKWESLDDYVYSLQFQTSVE